MRRPMFLLTLIYIFVLVSLTLASADEHQNIRVDRLAIEGYDPVAYFESGKAIPGKHDIVAERDGAIYRFASEDHRKTFAAKPGKYVPAYGGWCATAMAEGKKVEVDPRSFVITDGRLFLFYRDLFTDARKRWVRDEKNLTARADAEWKKIAGH